jgi:hypothetical protein
MVITDGLGGVLEDQFISDDGVLSSARVKRLEEVAATFDRYFNLYVICVDYFNYMRSLSHEHQPRGAGVYRRTNSSLMMESCLALVREDLKMLQQPSATATPTTSALGAETTAEVYRSIGSSRMMEFCVKHRREATHRSKLKSEAATKSKLCKI